MNRTLIIVVLNFLLSALSWNEVIANTSSSFIRIGRLWMICEYDGSEGWSGQCAWPGGYPYDRYSSIASRKWDANVRKLGTIAGCKNWTGPDGVLYPYWTSGMYRTYDYDYRDYWKPQTHQTSLYPVNQKLIRRWPHPKLIVNEKDITPPSGGEQINFNTGFAWPIETEINPELITELAVESNWDYSMGVTYHRIAYAYSNRKHQDYILWDLTFTNTGNISGIQLPELADQTIHDFWWTQTGNPWNSASGRYSSFGADDAVGEFIQPFSDEGNERRFYLFYDGDHEGDGVNDWGDPSINEQMIRLLSPAYIAYGALHVDKSANDNLDDSTQPLCTVIGHERNYDLGKQVKTMEEQYNVLFNHDSHWPLNTPHREVDPTITRPSGYTSIGPYTLEPNEDIHMILVWAAGGIDMKECRRLGVAAWEAGYSGSIMDEIETTVKTGRDSVLKTLNIARWNVKGDKGGRDIYDVPDAPRPPAQFEVKAAGAKIVLEWSDESENEPDFDTGINDFAGYRLYRAKERSDSTYYLIYDGIEHSYIDMDVTVGMKYFYYLVAYDDGSQNWEDPGVSLESGRFWCWTGWSENGVVPTRINLIHSPVTTAISGQSQAISVDLVYEENKTAQLYYRKGGAAAFDSLIMQNISGDTYEAIIPTEFITERGVEYFISTQDNYGMITTFPVNEPEIYPQVIQVTIENLNFPNPATASYQMFSVPFDLDDSSIESVLEDDLGNHDPSEWQLFRFLNEKYVEYGDWDGDPELFNFEPGQAFWLKTNTEQYLDTGAGKSITPAQNYEITLHPGWNQIANPFSFPISFSYISSPGAGRRLVGYYGAGTDTCGYDYTYRRLEPWQGYLIYNRNNAFFRAQVRAIEDTSSLPVTVKSILEQVTFEGNEWGVQITAQCNHSFDKDNYIGCTQSSADEVDYNDFPEVPFFDNYISLYFPHEDWTLFPGLYTADFRSIDSLGMSWDFTVRTNIPGSTVTLTLADMKNVPPDWDIELVDKANQVKVNFLENNVYTFMSDTSLTLRDFSITIGLPVDVESDDRSSPNLPKTFALLQNYPNPFNPSTKISYSIPTSDFVTLKVYNILGKEVKTLINKFQQPGNYTILFDSNDLSSGIYFYRIKVGNHFKKTNKMMLMR